MPSSRRWSGGAALWSCWTRSRRRRGGYAIEPGSHRLQSRSKWWSRNDYRTGPSVGQRKEGEDQAQHNRCLDFANRAHLRAELNRIRHASYTFAPSRVGGRRKRGCPRKRLCYPPCSALVWFRICVWASLGSWESRPLHTQAARRQSVRLASVDEGVKPPSPSLPTSGSGLRSSKKPPTACATP